MRSFLVCYICARITVFLCCFVVVRGPQRCPGGKSKGLRVHPEGRELWCRGKGKNMGSLDQPRPGRERPGSWQHFFGSLAQSLPEESLKLPDESLKLPEENLKLPGLG